MNISLPFTSDSGLDDMSGSDESNQGTSTFILTPVVSSLLSSKIYILLSMIVVGATVGLIKLFGAQTIIVVLSVTILYTSALLSFEFGPTGDVESDTKEHEYLLITSALAIPVVVGVVYMGFNLTGGFVNQASTGLLIIVGWYMNRQIYNSIKQDEVDLDEYPSHIWMHLTRTPFVSVLAFAVLSTVPFTVWSVMSGYLVFMGFAYGMLRLLTYEEDKVVVEMKETQEDNSPSNNLDQNISVTDDDTGEMKKSEDVVEEDFIESPTTPDVDNFELAEELTLELKESVDKVNDLLDDRDMSRQRLPSISKDEIPPSVETANNLFEETEKLAGFLQNYHPEDKELRMEVLEIQQDIQEIDEYIYMEIGSDSKKYK